MEEHAVYTHVSRPSNDKAADCRIFWDTFRTVADMLYDFIFNDAFLYCTPIPI